MSGLPRARVLRESAILPESLTRVVAPTVAAGPSAAQCTRIVAVEVRARDEARRILAEANAAARALLDDARARADGEARAAAHEAAEAERAKLAAQFIALRVEDARRDARDLQRTVDLARVLAERLLGEALQQDPKLVARLAHEVLAEARGARRVRLDAHPADVATLRGELAFLSSALPRDAMLDVHEDATLPRGSLAVHTDLGTLDARLPSRLERLAHALRDAITPHD